MKKKMYLMFAASALLLASCSQNELHVDSLPESKAIGFKNLNGLQTKFANDTQSNYGVFCAETDNSGYYSTMQNIEVDGTADTYSPSRFWPSDGRTLVFLGYAPFDAAYNSVTPTNTKVTFTVPANADVDFTIADSVHRSTGTVPLNFCHMLSQIELGDVTLAQELIDAGVTIDATNASIRLNVPASKAEFNLMDTAHIDISMTQTVGNYAGARKYYIIPQPIAASTAYIQLKNLTIDMDGAGGNPAATHDILAEYIPARDFVKNHKYTINFVIGGKAKTPVDPTDPTEPGDNIFDTMIEFSSDVEVWIEESLTFTTED